MSAFVKHLISQFVDISGGLAQQHAKTSGAIATTNAQGYWKSRLLREEAALDEAADYRKLGLDWARKNPPSREEVQLAAAEVRQQRAAAAQQAETQRTADWLREQTALAKGRAMCVQASADVADVMGWVPAESRWSSDWKANLAVVLEEEEFLAGQVRRLSGKLF